MKMKESKLIIQRAQSMEDIPISMIKVYHNYIYDISNIIITKVICPL